MSHSTGGWEDWLNHKVLPTPTHPYQHKLLTILTSTTPAENLKDTLGTDETNCSSENVVTTKVDGAFATKLIQHLPCNEAFTFHHVEARQVLDFNPTREVCYKILTMW